MPEMVVIGARSPILTDLDVDTTRSGVSDDFKVPQVSHMSTLLIPEIVPENLKMRDYVAKWRQGITSLSEQLSGMGFNYDVGFKELTGRTGPVVVAYVLWYTPPPNSVGRALQDFSSPNSSWVGKSIDEAQSLVKSAMNKIPQFRDHNYSTALIDQLPSLLTSVDCDITYEALSHYGVNGNKNSDWLAVTVENWIKLAKDGSMGLDHSNAKYSMSGEKEQIPTDENKSKETVDPKRALMQSMEEVEKMVTVVNSKVTAEGNMLKKLEESVAKKPADKNQVGTNEPRETNGSAVEGNISNAPKKDDVGSEKMRISGRKPKATKKKKPG